MSADTTSGKSRADAARVVRARPPGDPVSDRSRVLVLGDNGSSALATVRALGRAGYVVDVAGFDDRPLAGTSRYAHAVVDLGDPLRASDAFAAALIDRVAKTRYDFLLPASEAALVAAMPVREQLASFVRVGLPDLPAFEATSDKARTVEIAEPCGFDVPKTAVLRAGDPIDAALAVGRFPLIVKPSRSIAPDRERRAAVRVAPDVDRLQQWLHDETAHGPVLVQEHCAGFGLGVGVLALDGEVGPVFQYRRLHEPPSGGASSYRASMPIEAALLAPIERFCREIGFSGPMMFEYKRDPGTGRTAFMEVNGRLWGALPLAISAGVDFPRLWVDQLRSGALAPRSEYAVPCYSRYTPQEPYWLVSNLLVDRDRPELRRVGTRELGREITRIFSKSARLDIESLDDVRPGLVSARWLLAEILGDIMSRVIRIQRRRRLVKRTGEVRRRSGEWARRIRATESVLFLCHGNVNRSALAHHLLSARLGDGVSVTSAGFHPRYGRSTGPISREVAARHGVDLSVHRSRIVDAEELERADLIVVMDAENYDDVLGVDPGLDPKVAPLAAFDPDGRATGEIADPYGEPRARYEAVYAQIQASVDALAACIGATSD